MKYKMIPRASRTTLINAPVLAAFLCGSFVFSQVGINTTAPRSTLEIVAGTDGSTKTEGFMIPRLTGDQIQTMTSNLQSGTESLMIYATSAPAVPDMSVSKITKSGYYYWTGSVWENIGGLSSNIYTADGSITTALTARNIDLNGKNLIFSGIGSVGIGTANPSSSAKLDVAGTIKASAVDYNSDQRLKQNINPIPSSGKILAQLTPVSYFWNEKGKQKGGNAQLQYGLIAQEVEKVLPNIVSTDDEGYKSVNYNELIVLLLKSVQEQDIKIKELQQEIQNLKERK